MITVDSIGVSYELFQIPATDLHIALVLVQALSERLGILLTVPCSPVTTLICSVLGLARYGVVGRLRLGGGAGAGTSSKEAANGVANGAPNCDTAVKSLTIWLSA